MEVDLWVLRGKLEEKSGEISSVALLSPACLILIIIFFGGEGETNPTKSITQYMDDIDIDIDIRRIDIFK